MQCVFMHEAIRSRPSTLMPASVARQSRIVGAERDPLASVDDGHALGRQLVRRRVGRLGAVLDDRAGAHERGVPAEVQPVRVAALPGFSALMQATARSAARGLRACL